MTTCHIGRRISMPLETFCNLPKEKQEGILKAARKEFSRVSFGEASINKIIKDAGISRGSFYMYFADKQDLAYYLLSEYSQKMFFKANEILKSTSGDIFAVFIELFDSTIAFSSSADEDVLLFQKLFSSMHSNHLNQQGSINMREMLERHKKLKLIDEIIDLIDVEKLKFKSREDLEDLFSLLLSMTRQAIVKALFGMKNLPQLRRRFLNNMDMVRYGALQEQDSEKNTK